MTTSLNIFYNLRKPSHSERHSSFKIEKCGFPFISETKVASYIDKSHNSSSKSKKPQVEEPDASLCPVHSIPIRS